MTVEGVDYSYARPSPAGLAAAGKRFACRYLTIVNDTTRGKLLTRAEADKLHAAGIAIVSNWEYAAGDARGGRPAGVSYASAADVQHHAAGGPPDRPIYFSVDWDATPADLAGPVRAYFEGIASVLGVARTGAYGGIRTIDYLLDHKLITWAWQTYAWSGGQWDPRAHIQQYRNGVHVAGADCDLDRATVADYGQWGDGMAELTAVSVDGLKDLLMTDDVVFNVPWRADAASNPTIRWNYWFKEVAERVDGAYKLAEANAKAIADVLAAVKAGVVVNAQVDLTDEAVAKVADATADEIHDDPERDGP